MSEQCFLWVWWWAASCINTPNLRSLLHSFTPAFRLVGLWRVGPLSEWWSLSNRRWLSHLGTLTNLPPLCPVWEFLLRWELVGLKMDSRARRCPPSWNSVRSLERCLSASWGHTHTPAALQHLWIRTHTGGFLFLTVFSGSFTSFDETFNMF